jgi:hypothetical protein
VPSPHSAFLPAEGILFLFRLTIFLSIGIRRKKARSAWSGLASHQQHGPILAILEYPTLVFRISNRFTASWSSRPLRLAQVWLEHGRQHCTCVEGVGVVRLPWKYLYTPKSPM